MRNFHRLRKLRRIEFRIRLESGIGCPIRTGLVQENFVSDPPPALRQHTVGRQLRRGCPVQIPQLRTDTAKRQLRHSRRELVTIKIEVRPAPPLKSSSTTQWTSFNESPRQIRMMPRTSFSSSPSAASRMSMFRRFRGIARCRNHVQSASSVTSPFISNGRKRFAAGDTEMMRTPNGSRHSNLSTSQSRCLKTIIPFPAIPGRNPFQGHGRASPPCGKRSSRPAGAPS